MKSKSKLLPKYRRQIAQLGERLKLARLRRGLNAQMVADRAGISRQTLTRIEAGEPGVTLVHVFNVMRILGLAEDFDQLAADDEMGRKLQDLDLKTPKRGPRRKGSK